MRDGENPSEISNPNSFKWKRHLNRSSAMHLCGKSANALASLSHRGNSNLT
jgi:hypothetical protein